MFLVVDRSAGATLARSSVSSSTWSGPLPAVSVGAPGAISTCATPGSIVSAGPVLRGVSFVMGVSLMCIIRSF